jgi:hypothetical protein
MCGWHRQIAYTLNHSGASALLSTLSSFRCLEQIKDRLERVDRFVLIDDTGEIGTTRIC